VRAERQAEPAVVAALAERLVDQAAVDDRAAAAAQLLRDGHACDTGRRELLPDVGVPPALAVALGGSRRDDLLGQPLHRGVELLLLGREGEVHAGG
jgi:hypothetical protein